MYISCSMVPNTRITILPLYPILSSIKNPFYVTKPKFFDKEFECYDHINVNQWRTSSVMPNQPRWRVNWLRKHPNMIYVHAQPLRRMRIYPIIFPTIHWGMCKALKNSQRFHSTWMNYWVVAPLTLNMPVREHYMVWEFGVAITC